MSTRKKFYLAKSNQEGGTIENDFKEFSKYLMELIGATTDEELQNFVKKQGPEKVNEIYKQWKEQVPMAKDGMQFTNNLASKAQSVLIPGNIAIRNKIQDTAQDDLRGISSFKEAFAEAKRRGLRQFSWGKGSYTTELAQPTNKSTDKQITKKSTEEKSATPTNKKKESVNTVVEEKGKDTNGEVPDSLKRRDTPTPAQTVSNRKTTPTSVPTPLQPKDWGGLDDPMEWLKATGIVGTAAAGVGAGLYYGSNKYDQYKAAKLRAARAASAPAPTAAPRAGATPRMLTARPSAPKPGSTFRWEGTTPSATATAPPVATATASPKNSSLLKVPSNITHESQWTGSRSNGKYATFRWEGWKYGAPAVESAPVAPGTGTSASPASASTTPPLAPASRASRPGGKSGGRSEVMSKGKPGIRSKVTSRGMSGKSIKPNRTTSSAPRVSGSISMWTPPTVTAIDTPVPPTAPGLPTALRARATAGTGAAAPSAPARTLRVKARAGAMARTTLTAPPAAPPPSGSTFKWEGWKYDAAPKPEGTTPKPGVKPEGTTLKPKATAPKPGGKSGKSLGPSRATTLAGKLKMAGKMAGRANMFGMALGLISDLFPSKEAVELDRDAWEVSKNRGIDRDEVTINDVERYRRMKEVFKEGGKMNKLDYINKLNGECPEGYTAVKFAKGGVICTTCQKNKEVAAKKKNHLDSIKEEMKCGGKMKSHQKGGEMTKEQYRKLPLSKKVDQDLKDQAAGRNDGEGGTPITDLAASKKAAPKKLIKKPTKK